MRVNHNTPQSEHSVPPDMLASLYPLVNVIYNNIPIKQFRFRFGVNQNQSFHSDFKALVMVVITY